MKKILARVPLLVCTGAFALAFTGCPGGPGDGPEECGEGEVTHPYSGECVSDCSADETVCEGATPVCIGGGGADGGTADDSSSLFAGLCGCDQDSCGEGQVCNPVAGVCVDPCDPFVDGEADGGDLLNCPEIEGEAWACYPHPDTGDDYVCQPPCFADEDCPLDGFPVCDEGYCVATCDDLDEELRLICPNDDCNVSTGRCGGDAACMDNDDCGDRVCEVATGECVDCTDNAECGDMVCDLASGSCVGCEAQEDCGENQDCDLATGTCFETCTEIGEDPICTEDGQVCVPGDPVNTCEDPCQDEDCIADNEQLCELFIEEDEYNQCRDPDAVTGWCDNAQLAAHSRDPAGPIVQSISFVSESTDGNCDGTVGQYQAVVWSEDGLHGNLYTEGVVYLNAVGMDGLTYGSVTETNPIDGMPNYHEVDFTLCEEGLVTTFAIYVVDPGDNFSNAYCFQSGVFD